MRRGEKEGMRSEEVMSVNVLWRKKSHTWSAKRRCKNHKVPKVSCVFCSTLNIDPQ